MNYNVYSKSIKRNEARKALGNYNFEDILMQIDELKKDHDNAIEMGRII